MTPLNKFLSISQTVDKRAYMVKYWCTSNVLEEKCRNNLFK